MPLEEGARPPDREATGGTRRRAVRPQVLPRPRVQVQEGRLLHQEARHKPGRREVQGGESGKAHRRQGVLPRPGCPGCEAEEVLQGCTDEVCGVRVEAELRGRQHRVRDGHRDPGAQTDDTQLRPGAGAEAAGGEQDSRQSRADHGRLHQGEGAEQKGDEQRPSPHLRRRPPPRPGGQRRVAGGGGRGPRLGRRAGAGERRRGREMAAVHPPRHKVPPLHPLEGGDEQGGEG